MVIGNTGKGNHLACGPHLQASDFGTESQGREFEDAFSVTEAPPEELFINPFACAVDPCMWRELQVRNCAVDCDFDRRSISVSPVFIEVDSEWAGVRGSGRRFSGGNPFACRREF
jgi:hypothetical protein